MIAWQYAYLFVVIRGGDHLVASIDGVILDLSREQRTPWDVLNQLGADGWELVTAVPTAPMTIVRDPSTNHEVPESFWIFYLKRPRLPVVTYAST